MEKMNKPKGILVTIIYVLSIGFQILWLIAVFNYGDMLIGRAFSINEMTIFIEIPFIITICLSFIALILLMLSIKFFTKWKLILQIFLILLEFGLICHFNFLWFFRVWIRTPFTCFGLGYLFILLSIIYIQLAIQILILSKNKSRK